MKRTFGLFICFALSLLVAIPGPALAMTTTQQQEFTRIMNLGLNDLAEETSRLLTQQNPGETWQKYDFPDFVYTSKPVEMGYKIAVKAPEVLRINTCYCFCDTMGHTTLLNCFWKDGKVGGSFDDHASGCNICTGEAMLSFLWKNLGASDAEIRQGMAKKFEKLIKKP